MMTNVFSLKMWMELILILLRVFLTWPRMARFIAFLLNYTVQDRGQ